MGLHLVRRVLPHALYEDREPMFGDVIDGRMHVNAAGGIVEETWLWLPSHYPHVMLDEWCVMPNHLHGILVIRGADSTSGAVREPPCHIAQSIRMMRRDAKTFFLDLGLCCP